MEVQLDKRYPLDISVAQAWAVLSDIRATALCMPGAAITEQLDDTHYKGTVKTRVGPAVMSFAGDVEVLSQDAAIFEMQLKAQGADRSGSSATMQLRAHLEPGESAATAVLVGRATVTVSGKLAQFGSRMLVPVSDALLVQFASNFRSAGASVPAQTETGTDAAPEQQAAPSRAPSTPPPVRELNALALMWTVFKAWLAGLFGKRK